MARYFKLKPKNIIKVYNDSSCSMAMIEVNDECVMMGNYWDFNNASCAMYSIGKFNSYTGLLNLIKKYIEEKGKEYEVLYIKWNFDRWDREQQTIHKEVLFKNNNGRESGFCVTSSYHIDFYEYYPDEESDKVIHINNNDLGKLYKVLEQLKNDGKFIV